MKLVKMSLAAAMLMGASAYAIENVKLNGSAKLIYQTSDTTTVDLFDQAGATGGLGFTLGATADLANNMKGSVEMSGVDTLGLESNLVSSVLATNSVETQSWASVANIAMTFGNTTAVVGRQELNTPLAFTEKWNLVKNTFDAAVLVNSDIPNTTLVGAYVGKGNGSTWGADRTVAEGGTFTSAYGNFANGAYAVGAVFAGVPNNTIQAWYYNVTDVANAYWLQLDGSVAAGGDVKVSYGAQYANIEADAGSADNTGYAVKVGVDVAGMHFFGAFSDVDDGGFVGFTNVATADKTKLYTGTASIYADGGNVAINDTEAYKIGAKMKAGGVALAANFTDWETAGVDEDAWDVSAGTKVAGLGLKAIYTQYDNGTADTDTLRLIVSAKF